MVVGVGEGVDLMNEEDGGGVREKRVGCGVVYEMGEMVERGGEGGECIKRSLEGVWNNVWEGSVWEGGRGG